MRAMTRNRFPLLALGLALTFGCSAESPDSPTAPPAPPVPPSVGVNVSVSASPSTLEVGTTTFSTIVVRATRADNGAPVPNLTPGTVTTTLGNLGNSGGPQELAIELVNGQATVVLFPGTTVGTASIRAAVSTGVAFASVDVREPGTPDTFFLSSIFPNTGSPQGGETVTINGGGFSDPIRVTFDGVPAVIQNATGTQIQVRTPPCTDAPNTGCFATGGTKSIAVTVIVNLNEVDQATDTLTNGFTYVNGGGGGGTLQPTIFSVTPSSGPNEGGTQVTINGDGFEAPVDVRFGQISAQVVSVTRTRIVAVSPPASGIGQPNLNALVSVTVTNQSSGRTTTANAAFRYGVAVLITSLSPGQGTIYGGDLVTLFGQGFDAPVAVDFGGVAQQTVSVSGSEVVVRTTHPSICPAGALASHLVNIESGNGANGPGFVYLKPNIFSISPSSGPQSGGTSVTIGGANFGLPIIVTFADGDDARTGSVSNATATTISATTPAMPDSIFDEADCNEDGDETQGNRYIPTGVEVTVTDPVSGCEDTFEGRFTFSPTNTTCRGD